MVTTVGQVAVGSAPETGWKKKEEGRKNKGRGRKKRGRKRLGETYYTTREVARDYIERLRERHEGESAARGSRRDA